MTVTITRHAEARAKRRHSDLDARELITLAVMARKCGMIGPGYNGCRRYRYMGKEFVFDEKGGEAKLVTVI